MGAGRWRDGKRACPATGIAGGVRSLGLFARTAGDRSPARSAWQTSASRGRRGPRSGSGASAGNGILVGMARVLAGRERYADKGSGRFTAWDRCPVLRACPRIVGALAVRVASPRRIRLCRRTAATRPPDEGKRRPPGRTAFNQADVPTLRQPNYRLVDLFFVFTAVRTSTIPFLAPGTPPSSMRRCFSASTRASLMLRTDIVSLPY